MWRRSIRLWQALLGSILLAACNLACSAAYAQDRDEAWVISQIIAGKFEELRSLERLSDGGVPFAMYWWGSFLDRCVFDRCDEQAARALYLRAAKAGHGRAQAVLFSRAHSPADFASLKAEIGVPREDRARLQYTMHSLMVHLLREPQKQADAAQARADFVRLAASERQLGLLPALVMLEGVSQRGDELRAVASSGYAWFTDWMVRRADPQMLEQARAGELGLGAACETRASGGEAILPADTLGVCERAASQGYPGAVLALLRHHDRSGNARAAEYFISVCDALIGFRCAAYTSVHYYFRRNESSHVAAKWELWDLAMHLNMPGRDASRFRVRDKTERLRQSLYAMLIRTSLIEDACLTQRIDVASGAIEANPECPWRRPIAIPAEFLSGAR